MQGYWVRPVGLGNDNYNNNVNADNNFNNNRQARGIAYDSGHFLMKTYKRLFKVLYSWNNLEDAYWKARKHKSNNPAVKEFEKHWQFHLATLYRELKTRTYKPLPLKKFILRDPKTRTICVSDFRDRVVHHALVNVLQPVFEPRFIHDSYASRKGKGTTVALNRFAEFLRKVTKNGKRVPESTNANAVCGFAFKADIRHYFDTVDHRVLSDILAKHIKDKDVLWLAKVILDNYNIGVIGKGMPLGNWTSQFFANVYLNELDQYVKHTLKAKYYLRYVDDFIILDKHKRVLEEHEEKIKTFLEKINLELHPNKSKITPLCRGTSLLGFRVFFHHKTPRQRNIRKAWKRLSEKVNEYAQGTINAWQVLESLKGWNAYAMQGNTYHLRQRFRTKIERALTIPHK